MRSESEWILVGVVSWALLCAVLAAVAVGRFAWQRSWHLAAAALLAAVILALAPPFAYVDSSEAGQFAARLVPVVMLAIAVLLIGAEAERNKAWLGWLGLGGLVMAIVGTSEFARSLGSMALLLAIGVAFLSAMAPSTHRLMDRLRP